MPAIKRLGRWIPGILLAACAGCAPTAGEGPPPFVVKLVAEIKAEAKRNPPGSVWSYRYKDRVVFYVPPYCCDMPGELYASDGTLICAPDGGIQGTGDGQCRDFFEARTDQQLVWQDDR